MKDRGASLLQIENYNKQVDVALRLQYFNQTYYGQALLTMYGGDLAFYKNSADQQKRFKEIHATVIRYSWERETFQAMILDDEESPSSPQIIERAYANLRKELKNYSNKALASKYRFLFADDLRKENPQLDDATYDRMLRAYSRKLLDNVGRKDFIDLIFNKTINDTEFKKNNLSDAATYETIDRRIEFLIASSDYPSKDSPLREKYDKAVADLKRGIPLPKGIDINFGPTKPFYYNQNTDDVHTDLLVPVHMKNAQFPILPSIAYQLKNGEVGDLRIPYEAGETLVPISQLSHTMKIMIAGKEVDRVLTGDEYFEHFYKRPKLAKLHYNMLQKGADVAYFNSAQKVGEMKARTHDPNLPVSEVRGLITMSNDSFGIQQPVPDKSLDAKSIIGSQIRKLISQGVDKESILPRILAKYGIKTVADAVKVFEEDLELDISEKLQVIQDTFENNEVLRDKLIAMNFESNGSLDILSMLTLDADGEFEFNFDFPTMTKSLESMFSSLFDRANKIKTPGGAYANLSSYGMQEELEFKLDKDGNIEEVQVYVPMPFSWMDKEQFKNKNGIVTAEKIIEAGYGEFLEGIMYRIPTEGKYSMFPVKIKGFLPSSMGSSVVMPKELTTIAGLDFDVDKMFAFWKSKIPNKLGHLARNDIESFNELQEKFETQYKEGIADLQANFNAKLDEWKKKYPGTFRETFAFPEVEGLEEGVEYSWEDIQNMLGNAKNALYKAKQELKLLEEADIAGDTDVDFENTEQGDRVEELDAEIEAQEDIVKLANWMLDQIKEFHKGVLPEKALRNDLFEQEAKNHRAFIKDLNEQRLEELEQRVESLDTPYSKHIAKYERANKRIDIMYEILQTEESTSQTLERGNKDVYVEALSELVALGLSEDISNLNITDPTDANTYKSNNLSANGLIGIYANASAFMSLIEDRLKISSTLGFKVILDHTFSERDAGAQQEFLTRIGVRDLLSRAGSTLKGIQAGLFASTEAAKEPLQALMGINMSTAKFDILLTNMGLDKTFIGAFLLQPTLRGLLEKAAQEGKSPKKIIEERLRSLYDNKVPIKDILKEIPPLKESELFNSTIQEATLLKNYLLLNRIGTDYAAMIAASKVDSSLGVSIFSILEWVMKGQNILKRLPRYATSAISESQIFTIPNADQIVPVYRQTYNSDTKKIEWYIPNFDSIIIPQVKSFARTHLQKLNMMTSFFSQLDPQMTVFLDTFGTYLQQFRALDAKKSEAIFSGIQTSMTQKLLYDKKKHLGEVNTALADIDTMQLTADLSISYGAHGAFFTGTIKKIAEHHGLKASEVSEVVMYLLFNKGDVKGVDYFKDPTKLKILNLLNNNKQDFKNVTRFRDFLRDPEFFRLRKVLRYSKFNNRVEQVSDTKTDKEFLADAKQDFIKLFDKGTKYLGLADFLVTNLIESSGWKHTHSSFLRLISEEYFLSTPLGREIKDNLKDTGRVYSHMGLDIAKNSFVNDNIVNSVHTSDTKLQQRVKRDQLALNNPSITKFAPKDDFKAKPMYTIHNKTVPVQMSPSNRDDYVLLESKEEETIFVPYIRMNHKVKKSIGPGRVIEVPLNLVYKLTGRIMKEGQEYPVYSAFKPAKRVDYTNAPQFYKGLPIDSVEEPVTNSVEPTLDERTEAERELAKVIPTEKLSERDQLIADTKKKPVPDLDDRVYLFNKLFGLSKSGEYVDLLVNFDFKINRDRGYPDSDSFIIKPVEIIGDNLKIVTNRYEVVVDQEGNILSQTSVDTGKTFRVTAANKGESKVTTESNLLIGAHNDLHLKLSYYAGYDTAVSKGAIEPVEGRPDAGEFENHYREQLDSDSLEHIPEMKVLDYFMKNGRVRLNKANALQETGLNKVGSKGDIPTAWVSNTSKHTVETVAGDIAREYDLDAGYVRDIIIYMIQKSPAEYRRMLEDKVGGAPKTINPKQKKKKPATLSKKYLEAKTMLVGYDYNPTELAALIEREKKRGITQKEVANALIDSDDVEVDELFFILQAVSNRDKPKQLPINERRIATYDANLLKQKFKKDEPAVKIPEKKEGKQATGEQTSMFKLPPTTTKETEGEAPPCKPKTNI